MKRIALTAMAALIALAVAVAPASAETVVSVQKFAAKVTPNKAGTPKKPQPIALSANPFFETNAPDLDRQVQFATVNANVFFPKGGVYNGKYFPSCEKSVVFQDETQCPKGSQVGRADGFGKGLGLDESVVGKFFNLPGGKGTTLLVTGDAPLIIREVVDSTITKLNDPNYSYKLAFSVPRNLQSPAPGVIASVMKFDSKIPVQFVKKGKKRIPLLATTSCPAGGWKFRYQADYTTTFDGAIASSQTVDTVVPCKK